MPTKSTAARTSNRSTGKKKQSGTATQKNTSQKKKSQQTTSSLSLRKIFEDLLHDTYDAEVQLVEALPEMAQAAYSDDLREAFEDHLEQTKKHVERLDRVYDRLGIDKSNKTCEAMQGLVAEGQHIIEEYEESPARDSALIVAAQKVEHYEIAAYGSLCELADVLGYQNTSDILGRTLNEEEETDELLTTIAMDVNDEAYESTSHEEEEEVEEEEESYSTR
jgi:ferritin-like metal-binding protein YciE